MSVPWGISEAAFSERDPQGDLPLSGLWRSRAGVWTRTAPTGLVVSPYSTFLALLVDPERRSVTSKS